MSSQELCGFLTVCLALLGALFLEGLVLKQPPGSSDELVINESKRSSLGADRKDCSAEWLLRDGRAGKSWGVVL